MPHAMQVGPMTDTRFFEDVWSLEMPGLEGLSRPLLNCELAEDLVCQGSLKCTMRPM